MSFIITGCQRSGTMTASKIFGIDHEIAFNPLTMTPPKIKNSEASWMAMPFVKKIPDIKIIHLVRCPYDVIASLLGIGFWVGAEHQPYRDFIFKYLPYLKKLNDTLELSIRYYIEWNKPLLAYPRIRIEDIQECPVYNSRPHLARLPDKVLESVELSEMAREFRYIAQDSG